MTTVYLLAVILAINGDRVTVDKGLIDGLRAGDIGSVYYTLTINATRERQVEVAKCEVASVGDSTAVLQVIGQRSPIQVGYTIRFHLPVERTSPAELLAIAQRRLSEGKLDVGMSYLQRIRREVPGNALVESLIEEITKKKQDEQVALIERQLVETRLAEANRAVSEEDYQEALGLVEQVLKVAPENRQALALKQSVEGQLERRRTMLFVADGDYYCGVDKAQARYYNQQPRFETHLDSVWVDRSPSGLVGLSYDEAERHCRRLSKRLPTEFELETAATLEGFTASENAEWTASWYQPYPGNTVKEAEYGQFFRVTRGPEDFRVRTFLLPSEKALDTTFRCACDAGSGPTSRK